MIGSMIPNRKVEKSFWAQGHQFVAGVDEVGRGALAGPVVAAAVILPSRYLLSSVRDSKLMTPKARQQAAILIKQQAVAVGIGWVSNVEVDKNGLTWAVRQSGERALLEAETSLRCQFNPVDRFFRQAVIKVDIQNSNDAKRRKNLISAVILDGKHNYLSTTHNSVAVIKADQSILCVAAASVIAKVARDSYMELFAIAYPTYGFSSNKGYGTALHLRAVQDKVTPLHRRLFLRKQQALGVN